MASNKEKSLDHIETQLTPKEWAIREADALRGHPAMWNYLSTLIETPGKDSIDKAVDALARQAETRHSENREEDIDSRSALFRRLWTDYFTLIRLICDVNQTIEETVEIVGLKTALTRAIFPSFIHHDDSDRSGFQSRMNELVEAASGLIAHIYAHRIAVKTIQDKGFDGHPILANDIEARFQAIIESIHDDVALFNDCLKAMVYCPDKKAQRESPTINMTAIEETAKTQAAALAGTWTKRARYGALIQGASHERAKNYARQYYLETSQKAS